MIELTKAEPDKYVPLKEIAAKQNISQKYLESIMSVLSKGGVVNDGNIPAISVSESKGKIL